jgi:hypothetical protein
LTYICTGQRKAMGGGISASFGGGLGQGKEIVQKPSNRNWIMAESAQGSEMDDIENVRILDPDSETTRATMWRLETVAHHYRLSGSPRTDLILHLIQFHFTKALMENSKILGLTTEKLHDDAISPFNTAGPWQQHEEIEISSIPASLQPTIVQRTVPHHPWFDLLPIPQMRDNLILAGESYDETQLCYDMKGRGKVCHGKPGIVVWRDPWDPTGWEVTDTFARDWGWVIWKCNDLFRSTNYWRAQRGERELCSGLKPL